MVMLSQALEPFVYLFFRRERPPLKFKTQISTLYHRFIRLEADAPKERHKRKSLQLTFNKIVVIALLKLFISLPPF